MPSVVLHCTKKVTICRRLKNITNIIFSWQVIESAVNRKKIEPINIWFEERQYL